MLKEFREDPQYQDLAQRQPSLKGPEKEMKSCGSCGLREFNPTTCRQCHDCQSERTLQNPYPLWRERVPKSKEVTK